jgi:hypothetical protein
MSRADEVVERTRELLEPDEVVVRPPLHGRRCWLLLTDRKLLVLHADRLGHPRDVTLLAPLHDVQVDKRWLWSKLQSGLSIRTGGARHVVCLASTRGTRTRVGMARALRRFVDDVARWQAAAGATGGAERTGTTAFLLVRDRALRCLTPAQLARELDIDTAHVAELARGRCGLTLSKGAAGRYTYTKRDREQFGPDARRTLFEALVEERGREAIVAGALGHEEWWRARGAQGAEALLGLADVAVGHTSARRRPIARWQAWMLWVGFVAAAILALPTLGIVPSMWKRSWERWRSGDADRPDTAIGIGTVVTALALGALVVSLVVLPIVRAVG